MSNKLDSFLNSQKLNKLLLPTVIIYACLVLYGSYIHESWGDEAQAWLLTRDLGFVEFFKILPTEGHPPLWYLLIMPFSKLGFPYEIIKILAALISIGAVYILLLKTKAPNVLKLSLPFSYYIAYQYAIFGRSYCLILFFIAAIISLYPKRFEKPWLFALCVVGLFNTHMLVFTFACCIVLLFVIDAVQQKKLKGQVLASVVLMLTGGLYLIPYLTTSKIAEYYTTNTLHHDANLQNALTFGLFIHRMAAQVALTYFESSWINPQTIFLFIVFLLTLPRPKIFLLLATGLAGILYIMGYKYSFIQIRHFGVIFIVFAMCYCLMPYYKDDAWNLRLKYPLASLGALLLAFAGFNQIPITAIVYADDNNRMYSGSKDVAEFLRENNMEYSIIAACHPGSCYAILPYLPKDVKFYYPSCDCLGTYYDYVNCFEKNKNFPAYLTIKKAYDKYRPQLRKLIYLVNFKIDLVQVPFLEMVYESPEDPIYIQERFQIYKYKERYIIGDSLSRAGFKVPTKPNQ
jgi:hypothetical protein